MGSEASEAAAGGKRVGLSLPAARVCTPTLLRLTPTHADRRNLMSQPISASAMLAYAAAATLCGISALANLKFGMSLGADRVDQMALGGASVAVDVLKAALPLLVLNLWRRRYRVLAVVSAVLWIGCLSWSACSAIGFAVDSRSQVNADRTMQSAASQGSMATIGRAERQLTAIGTTRPVAVVKADLAAANVPASRLGANQGMHRHHASGKLCRLCGCRQLAPRVGRRRSRRTAGTKPGRRARGVADG